MRRFNADSKKEQEHSGTDTRKIFELLVRPVVSQYNDKGEGEDLHRRNLGDQNRIVFDEGFATICAEFFQNQKLSTQELSSKNIVLDWEVENAKMMAATQAHNLSQTSQELLTETHLTPEALELEEFLEEPQEIAYRPSSPTRR